MTGESTKDLRRTFREGCDEYFEHICDSCITEHHQREAKAYCVDCAQNICNECVKCHKKITTLKGHIIETKPRPISSTGKDEGTRPSTTHYCSIHPTEMFKFYCNDHQTLVCPECLLAKHRECQKVATIREVSRDISGQMKSLTSDIKKHGVTLKLYKTNCRKIRTDITESYTTVVDQIKQFRSDINKILDDLEHKLLERAADLKMDANSSLAENMTACEELISEMKKLLKVLDDNRKLGNDSQMFISIKQTQETMSKMVLQADRIGEECKPRRLSFYRHENVASILSTIGLGFVGLSGDNIQVKYSHDIYVKSNTDTQDCNITGITVLPDGRLCFCDLDNKSIKLIDTQTMAISDHLTLSTEPRVSAMVNEKELVVLLPDEKKVQVVRVTPTLQLGRAYHI